MYICKVKGGEFFCNAQMAESVDALVSNTSGAIRAGSIPALGTKTGWQILPSCFRTQPH